MSSNTALVDSQNRSKNKFHLIAEGGSLKRREFQEMVELVAILSSTALVDSQN